MTYAADWDEEPVRGAHLIGEELANARPGTSIHIEVNGERQTTPSGSTVAGLLEQLDIRSDRVAVELNLQILDRQNFDRQCLQEGDRIEIISFIGGGSGEAEASRSPRV